MAQPTLNVLEHNYGKLMRTLENSHIACDLLIPKSEQFYAQIRHIDLVKSKLYFCQMQIKLVMHKQQLTALNGHTEGLNNLLALS